MASTNAPRNPSVNNGGASMASNGTSTGANGGPKVDPRDPQVRKLVYNMYRGMLDQKHQKANVIVDSVPREMVTTDEGVGSRVESMMRQQSELKGGNMYAGGPPPPPPPPPIPGVVPPSRLPSEIPAHRAPVMNPPAALAGAMMKDKKPFTYTPGGLDLSEINPQGRAQNGDPTADLGPPVQSRSFRLLQNVLDHQDPTEPQGPVHIPTLRQQQQQATPFQAPTPHYQQNNYQPPAHYQQPSPFQPQFQHPGGQGNTAVPSEQEVPEPKKYMGGSIPSRSFRMLQAMTNPEEASDNSGVPANAPESTHASEGDKQHGSNQVPSSSSSSSTSTSPNWKSATQSSPTSLSPPSSTLTNTNDTSSDSGISSPSKVSPSYTTTKDSKVYRNVAPTITMNGPKQARVVNSALSSHSKEPSSPYTNCGSPSWKVNQPKFFPPVSGQKLHDDSNQDSDRDSPRLMKIIRQESSTPQNEEVQVVEKRYEGGHIPSRVFRHLMTEYPSDEQDASKAPVSAKTPIPPRVIKSLQNEGNTSFDSDASSSYAELDEYYSSGAAKTAAHKGTVLKELTSQFDQMGTRKKPKAAPGRVFRYLQQQYDTSDDLEAPQEVTDPSLLEPEAQETQGFGYRGSKLPSPSFRYLQNQYQADQQQQQEEEQHAQDDDPHSSDAPQYEKEPTPYRGARLPGRTFRSLQENGSAHPSVLGGRK